MGGETHTERKEKHFSINIPSEGGLEINIVEGGGGGVLVSCSGSFSPFFRLTRTAHTALASRPAGRPTGGHNPPPHSTPLFPYYSPNTRHNNPLFPK